MSTTVARTLGLYKTHKCIERVREARGLKTETLSGHLATAYGSGHLELAEVASLLYGIRRDGSANREVLSLGRQRLRQ